LESKKKEEQTHVSVEVLNCVQMFQASVDRHNIQLLKVIKGYRKVSASLHIIS
jgi:hypothetical protein